MNTPFKFKLGLLIVLLSTIFFSTARAATLETILEKNITSAKDDVVVLISINSEGESINTAQAVVTFPPNLLSITQVDNSDSVFNFWLEGPIFDNSKGTIRFAGGSISGINGPNLKLMKVVFKVKGSGSGRIAITEGAINSSDGTGSNVYNTAKGLDINIPSNSEFEVVTLQKEKTAATIAKELPGKLGLEVPFYPDQTKWYNHSASFLSKWRVNSDTTSVGIALNKTANFIPEASSDGLTGSKIFPALEDGVWYLHLRSKNSLGWTPTLHYRISIDTGTPTAFNIVCSPNCKTGNPKPIITFVSGDLLSGIDNYLISLDGLVITTISSSSYQFLPLLPGSHNLSVSAVDKAGNSISQIQKIEILPIASPEITYVSDRIIMGEDNIIGGGISSVGKEVKIQLENSLKQVIFEKTISVDSKNGWNIVINKVLNVGDYYLVVTAIDANLASSLPVVSEVIKVQERPLLTLGGFEISQGDFYSWFIIIIFTVLFIVLFTYYTWQRRVSRKVIFTEKDVDSVLGEIEGDVKELNKNYSDDIITKTEVFEGKSMLKKIQSVLSKARRESIKKIDEIDD